MVISQGDVFWITIQQPHGSEPGYRHPYVIIQSNRLNVTAIQTVLVCLVTSNVQRANDLGNVLLNKGEANLPKQSVVNVSQVVTVDKRRLVEKVGTLSPQRVQEIVNGLRSITDPAFEQ